MSDALVDSSFLYAVFDASDRHHKLALALLQEGAYRLLLPDVVLPEVTFLLRQAGGIQAAARFLGEIAQAGMSLECVQWVDIRRSKAIMSRYHEAHLDFVDCCIVALAERLNITRVCTFDHRDFRIIRPAHAEYLELLP